MKLSICLSVTLSVLLTAHAKVFMCYLGTWARYRTGNGQFLLDHINTTVCTHLIYSFVGVDANGTVITLDSYLDIDLDTLNKFNELKSNNSDLKTLLAVGGWNEGSEKYSNMAADANLRSNFVQSALSWVRTYNFDGFDLDWEYPARRGGIPEDKANFALLLKEFRETFDQYGLLVTAAVSATSIDVSYDVPSLSTYLDYINVMSYDLHGSYENFTGHHAGLYASSIDLTDSEKTLNVDSVIQDWISKGAAPEKLVLGLGAYGRSYILASSTNVSLGAPTVGGGTAGPYTLESGSLGYHEIVEKLLEGTWTVVWDNAQMVPHAYSGNEWIGYDNPDSIALKVKYALTNNLGGVMIWSIENDDFLGLNGTMNPLLDAVRSTLDNAGNPISVSKLLIYFLALVNLVMSLLI